MENLVTLTIRSTHYYLIEAGQGWFMVDAGWAGSLPELKSHLRRTGIDLAHIRHVMITHHHPDHAGLAQEIKQAAQARLVIHRQQIPYLENLEAFYAGKGGYLPIQVEANDLVVGDDNRAVLNRIGVQGEIVRTPGHSDDSVSLVLDSGLAFVGDLHPPAYVPEEARALTRQSWKELRRRNVRRVYPAHGEPFFLGDVDSG